MNDLVKRLRERAQFMSACPCLETEAADRIEELEAQCKSLYMGTDMLRAEIKRLRRVIGNMKIQGYERGQKWLHDMALKALEGSDE